MREKCPRFAFGSWVPHRGYVPNLCLRSEQTLLTLQLHGHICWRFRISPLWTRAKSDMNSSYCNCLHVFMLRLLTWKLDPKISLDSSRHFGLQCHRCIIAHFSNMRFCCVSIDSQAQPREELPDLGEWGGPHQGDLHGEGRQHEAGVWEILHWTEAGTADHNNHCVPSPINTTVLLK